ncbi:PapB/FocB family fimbrial expression transcriptional regulator [Shewanella sp.]|uniref:PapB/FocB family fimbrial expression transcriptional regulator n=1 Tax=Shewanella sp. TaxID=50422 RepID=UPI003F2B45F7
MKYLLPGGESDRRFELLLSLTRLSSDNVVSALRDYLVHGMSDTVACVVNRVAKGNFSRSSATMNDVSSTVEAIKEIDWEKLSVK